MYSPRQFYTLYQETLNIVLAESFPPMHNVNANLDPTEGSLKCHQTKTEVL